MKKILISIIAVFCLASCTNLDDTYSDYTGNGERIFVGKMTEVKILKGYERLAITGSKKYMSTATQCIIELVENGKIYKVDIVNDRGDFYYEIPDLEEGNYYIKINTTDKDGNLSVTETYNVDVYGAKYISALYPKKVTDMAFQVDKSINVSWSQADKVSDVIINYLDRDGKAHTDTIDGTASITNLPSWKPNSTLITQTRILPEPTALDTISLEKIEYQFPDNPTIEIPTTNFRNMAMPSDAVNAYGGDVVRMWDGDIDNLGYHSADGQGVPQHFTMDLGLTTALTECVLYYQDRQDWTPKKVQLWGIEDVANLADYEPSVPSTDPAWEQQAIAKGWKKLSIDDIPIPTSGTSTKFACDESQANIRYIRYRVLEVRQDGGGYGIANEIKFWGKDVNTIP